MDSICRIKIGVLGAGLTNQLGFIVTGIMKAYVGNKRFIIIDDFNTQYNILSRVPISTIVDLEPLNRYLKKLGLLCSDSNVSLSIDWVKYGSGIHVKDVTAKTLERFYKNGALVIPRSFSLNDLDGDPLEGSVKNLYIKYRIGDFTHTVSFNEHRSEDIILDLSQVQRYDHEGWINLYDIDQYNEILSNIVFNNKFREGAEIFFSKINSTEKINAIHLRDDQDAIQFWARINKIPGYEFAERLNDMYIGLVKKYFKTKHTILVITGNKESRVIKYLEENGYNYHISEKNTGGRETDAIVDLLISERCNNIFIGNYNLTDYLGSTFSYLIYRRLPDDTKCVMIDMDHIRNNPVEVIKE